MYWNWLHYRLNIYVGICKDIYSNIVLYGGTTVFPGISEHIFKDITALSLKTIKSNILAFLEKIIFGKSILAAPSTFQSMCSKKNKYDESGQ